MIERINPILLLLNGISMAIGALVLLILVIYVFGVAVQAAIRVWVRNTTAGHNVISYCRHRRDFDEWMRHHSKK
ncbi:hypothetical protein [Intestinibacillus sp. Marseille-P6563]|uniref:hypothetical protein n=1 Tax=Intestinibacillus sp. Marseille-P6563 TaxID=2364792 RepID=UPI000F059160|nr:hypothetical protein [Intestinibacillus sp. Marseille-P6563]